MRWNRRGLTLSRRRCSRGQGRFAWGLGSILTIYTPHSFVPKNNWKQIIQKAVITDADGRQRSYWPDFWSMKYLNERKIEDRVAFAYQYLNTAIRTTDVGISPELIIKKEVPEDYDCLGVGTDLSAGLREKNDWTVMTLGGMYEGKIYLIDQRRARTMGNIEKMDLLCEMLADWNILIENDEGQYFPTMSPCVIWPEAVAYQNLSKVILNE